MNCFVNFLLSFIVSVVLIDWNRCGVYSTPTLNENQIIEDIKFLSRSDDGSSPSRLRALLLADLKKVLIKNQPEKNDCVADADLKVNTLNCTCTNHTCPSRLLFPHKRSRFLITRNCEDLCCRKRTISKKSTPPFAGNLHQCEIGNNVHENDVNDFRIKSMVQIFSVDSKQPICLGSLVHPKAVLTTLECITMHMNRGLYVKVKETVDKFQNLYQVRNVTKKITPDNFMDRIEKLRFNMALLVLDKEIETNSEIEITCLPKYQESARSLSNRKCFITSLEYINGRLIEKTESVKIYESDKCRDILNHQHRLQIFFPKQNICAGRSIITERMKIKSNGAPLICIHEQTEKNSGRFNYYIQYGLLAWTTGASSATESIASPHLFTNINNYRYWLDKNLKKIV